MATKKISAMTAAATIAGTELIPIVQSGVNKTLTPFELVQLYDYVIDKVGSTYYARPGIGTGYTAYSGANFKTTIESAMGQLTTGGTVFIKAGLYDNLDPIVVNNVGITIQGAGRYLTKLKLKDDADAAGGFTYTGLIQCVGYNNFTIKDIELDGNGANQTLIDNGASQTARLFGIRVGYTGSITDHILIDNVYVHDFTVNGIQVSTANDILIRNCRSEDNNWNNISMSGSTNALITDCTTHGAGDVGISPSGTDIRVVNCSITDLDGVHGSVNSAWGIEMGVAGDASARISIENCSITGAHIVRGIQNLAGTVDCLITGNLFYDLTYDNVVTISMQTASYFTISNNKIVRADGQQILLHACTYCSVLNNDASQGTRNTGVSLETNSLYNKVIGNSLQAAYGISVGSGCNYNYIMSNYCEGTNWTMDFTISGTGNVYRNNICKGISGLTNKWAAEAGTLNFAVTATADGLTTGILTEGSQNLTVTSASANNIVALPAASASTIGTKITGIVGANGFELRVNAAQLTTVYINGITTNVEAAIPASTTFEITCIDATHWILKDWTALGAVTTAIIPDAL